MAKHCPKHDITGDECWCCEEEKINAEGAEHRDRMYSDPEFLAKRGGAAYRQVVQSHAMRKLSELKPEHLDRLIALAQGADLPPAPSGRRTVVAAS